MTLAPVAITPEAEESLMKPRVRRAHSRPGTAGDGLDDKIWGVVTSFVDALGRGDAAAARRAIPRLERDLPNDGQAASYIWYLLRYRVVEMLERRPTPDDLHELAISAWPRFGEIVHGDERLVEDILRSVFKQTPLQDEMTGAKLIVLGSATLGVLLNDPPNDLDSIRPHLAEWWRRNLEDFRKQGIIGAQRPTGLGVGGDRVHGRSVNDPLNGGGEGPWVKRASE